MPRVRTRIEPIERDVDVIFREELSPQARSKWLAQFARQALREGQEQNRRVLGRIPTHDTWVDGTAGANEDHVRPDGKIVYEFELISNALAWINTELQKHSPVRSGLYAKSHELFADGTQVDNPNDPPIASEYVFLNIQPYARKIERGLSPQAPEGVFEVVAAMATRRFGNMARIRFTYRSPILPYGGLPSKRGGLERATRAPAILVTMR